jgi:hypothetical protein
MAVTFTSIERTGYTTWRFEWAGSAPYAVYIDGLLVATTTQTWWEVEVGANQVAQFEVIDDGSEPQPGYPGWLTLQWPAVEDAEEYWVQEYVNSSWVTRGVITRTGGSWYRWETDYLDDETTAQWRVVPYAEGDIAGGPLSWSAAIVRIPGIPQVDYAYDSGTTKITISES